jgi:hypothetical protein
MRNLIAAAILAAGCSLPGLAAAQAQPASADLTIKAMKCSVGMRGGGAEGSRPCTSITLSEDIANGRLTIRFAFEDGFRLEIAGPSLAVGGRDRSVTPDSITWANPGQTNPQVDANTPASRAVRGRCVVSKFKGTEQIGSVGCELAAASIGRLGVAFRAHSPPKD